MHIHIYSSKRLIYFEEVGNEVYCLLLAWQPERNTSSIPHGKGAWSRVAGIEIGTGKEPAERQHQAGMLGGWPFPPIFISSSPRPVKQGAGGFFLSKAASTALL